MQLQGLASILLFTHKTYHAFPQRISQGTLGTSRKRRQHTKRKEVSQAFRISFLKMPILWGIIGPEMEQGMICMIFITLTFVLGSSTEGLRFWEDHKKSAPYPTDLPSAYGGCSSRHSSNASPFSCLACTCSRRAGWRAGQSLCSGTVLGVGAQLVGSITCDTLPEGPEFGAADGVVGAGLTCLKAVPA